MSKSRESQRRDRNVPRSKPKNLAVQNRKFARSKKNWRGKSAVETFEKRKKRLTGQTKRINFVRKLATQKHEFEVPGI